jgi:23S rRNA pseudouridine1911/1915/1917 synthase
MTIESRLTSGLASMTSIGKTNIKRRKFMIEIKKKGQWCEITVPEQWSTFSLDDLIRSVWKAPKKLIHSYRMGQDIRVNGEPPNWNKHLSVGDKLQIKLFQSEEFHVIPTFHDVELLYEDDFMLILNKPANMDTHPNEPGQKNTLLNAATFHMQASGERLNPRHIHRLDRDTTGTVLFAKNALIGAILDRMLEERKIKRTYLAMTDGLLHKDKGTINKPIGRDRHHPVRRRVSNTGQPAVTHFEVIKRLQKENRTLIRCSLDTGRTHQIRVHLSDLGHPLTGDVLYGGSNVLNRQALHAIKIEFVHPFTEETIVCHAPFLDQPPIFTNINPYSI